MRKFTLAMLLLSSFAGLCAQTTASAPKVLVAYYSYSGNTRFLAEQISHAVGGTLFEIRPAKAYPADYSVCVEQAKKECAIGFKPELAENLSDLSGYQVIFIGSPNWWGTMAPPVATFLSSHQLKGKLVIPFLTHGGGGVQNYERDVRKLCSEATLKPAGVFFGRRIRRSADEIKQWLKSVYPQAK